MKLEVSLLVSQITYRRSMGRSVVHTDTGAVGLIPNADGGSSFDVTLTAHILENLNSIPAGQWHIKATTNYG